MMMETAIFPARFRIIGTAKNSDKDSRRIRTSGNFFTVRSSVEDENPTPSRFSFDLSNMPDFDINRNRRANYNARRRIVQNRGVPDIHPEIFGNFFF